MTPVTSHTDKTLLRVFKSCHLPLSHTNKALLSTTDNMAALRMIYILVALVFTFGHIAGQLITPNQACQMKCISDIGHYVTVESKSLFSQGCLQYCNAHAYDDLLALLKSTQPPQNFDNQICDFCELS